MINKVFSKDGLFAKILYLLLIFKITVRCITLVALHSVLFLKRHSTRSSGHLHTILYKDLVSMNSLFPGLNFFMSILRAV